MLKGPSDTAPQIIESSLRAIREHLDMPVAYLSQFVNGRVVYRNVDAPGYRITSYNVCYTKLLRLMLDTAAASS